MSSVGGAGGARLGSVELSGSPEVVAAAERGRTIAIGARGAEVRAIQAQLRRLGWLAGPADGIYGRQTQAAVAAFQRASGLSPTGDVDPATLAALDQALQIGAKKPVPGAPRPNEIVFVGMGKDTPFEIRDLKRRAPVHGIPDAATGSEDKVTFRVAGRLATFDLKTDAGIDGYLRANGVSGAKAREAAAIIRSAGEDARDETAQVVSAFVQAERGERTVERLVLSGHSVGSGVWGDENGYFELETMKKVARAFPRAARQVEDFLVAGCYSSSERHVELFREMFPNLKTSMAYGDSAPGTWTGAMDHNARWEQATRGSGDPGRLDRALFAGTRKGENVATWNAVDGYQGTEPLRPLAEHRATLARLEPERARYFSGEAVVADTQTGPLRDYYRATQRMLGHPQLPAAERPGIEAKRDATIRLIFYDATVKGRFQQAHGAAVRAGYAALGLAVPDFSQLSRKQALEKIAAFEAALAARSPKPQAAVALKPLLADGLRDLKASAIPATWV